MELKDLYKNLFFCGKIFIRYKGESMEELRDNDGYLVLDKLAFQMVDDNLSHLIFYIDGVKFYFKEISNVGIYNELIIEELSKDFNIECAHYDLANYKGIKGVISEDFIKDNKFIPMTSIIGNYYKYNEDFNKHNNLMDIWSALDYKYKDENISNKLMDDIVNMYLFDILVGNGDRNIGNYGIIETKDEVKLSPIYDNENMLSHISLFNGEYCVGVDDEENIFSDDYTGSDNKFLIKFLKQSSSEYADLLKNKLWIISQDNIDKVLKRVEDRINCKISENIKNDIKAEFNINYENIKYTLEYNDERKL